jgi:hypothetical protein
VPNPRWSSERKDERGAMTTALEPRRANTNKIRLPRREESPTWRS